LRNCPLATTALLLLSRTRRVRMDVLLLDDPGAEAIELLPCLPRGRRPIPGL